MLGNTTGPDRGPRMSDYACGLQNIRLVSSTNYCRREIASKPREGRGAQGEREDIPSGHPLASGPVPLA